MLRYFISILVFMVFLSCFGQSKTIDLSPKDTVTQKYAYGLRIGVDISRPIIAFLDENYSGLELVGDFRLTEKWWLAAELGNEEKTIDQTVGQYPLYNYTSSGSYLKVGGDYNTYSNWYGMRNQIHIGGRIAYSTFSQTLNNFRYFDSNRFFSPDEFALGSNQARVFDSRSATWVEFVVGIKAEVFKNTFVGITARLGNLLSFQDDEFRDLWIPGFNRVTENAKWGVGYNFSLSYFVPFFKKVKKKEEEKIKE